MAKRESRKPKLAAVATEQESGIKCWDDTDYAMGCTLVNTALAINPKAGILELALGTQARVHRLVRVMQDVATGDSINNDSVCNLANYAQEIAAIADATV